MMDFFTWIASLEPEQAWALFVLVASLMAVVPFAGTWLRALGVKFSNQSLVIHDFSWRIIPNTRLGMVGDKKYYVTNSEQPLLYEGMVVLLNWHVKGAYRVDIRPLGKNIKGNSAHVVLHKGQNHYLLTAYGWRKKISMELTLPVETVKTLQTFNLSKEDHFKQPHSELQTTRLASSSYEGTFFSRLGIKNMKRLLLNRIYAAKKRTYPQTSQLEFETTLKNEKRAVRNFVEAQQVVKTYTFHPEAYNQAISEYNHQQKTKNTKS